MKLGDTTFACTCIYLCRESLVEFHKCDGIALPLVTNHFEKERGGRGRRRVKRKERERGEEESGG